MISLGETRFGLNKTATKNILPDTYGTFPGVELKTSSRLRKQQMKPCYMRITITLGVTQTQSCIESINDGGTNTFFTLDHINYAS